MGPVFEYNLILIIFVVKCLLDQVRGAGRESGAHFNYRFGENIDYEIFKYIIPGKSVIFKINRNTFTIAMPPI